MKALAGTIRGVKVGRALVVGKLRSNPANAVPSGESMILPESIASPETIEPDDTLMSTAETFTPRRFRPLIQEDEEGEAI